jgi:hypothetical protein
MLLDPHCTNCKATFKMRQCRNAKDLRPEGSEKAEAAVNTIKMDGVRLASGRTRTNAFRMVFFGYLSQKQRQKEELFRETSHL